MECDCGAHSSVLKWKGDGKWECTTCGGVSRPYIADAYFKEPYFDPHLGDAKHPQGQWVTDKTHKGRIMKEQGIRESGDKFHGAR